MQELREAWEPFERVWVTFDKSDARSLLRDERVIHALRPDQPQHPEPVAQPAARATRPPPRAAVGDPHHGRRRRRPVRVDRRAARRPRSIYVESVTRIEGPSLSGRMIAPVADAPVRAVARARRPPRGASASPATCSRRRDDPRHRRDQRAAVRPPDEGRRRRSATTSRCSSSTAPRTSPPARGEWVDFLSFDELAERVARARASSSAMPASARSCSRAAAGTARSRAAPAGARRARRRPSARAVRGACTRPVS